MIYKKIDGLSDQQGNTNSDLSGVSPPQVDEYTHDMYMC